MTALRPIDGLAIIAARLEGGEPLTPAVRNAIRRLVAAAAVTDRRDRERRPADDSLDQEIDV